MSERWLQEALPALQEVLEREREAGRSAACERMEAFREAYLGLREAGADPPLAELAEGGKPAPTARLKGAWVLWMLRERLGEPAFGELMESRLLAPGSWLLAKAGGGPHAERPGTDLTRSQEPGARSGSEATWLEGFFDFWVCGAALPDYRLVSGRARPKDGGYQVTVKIANHGTGAFATPLVLQTEEGARHSFPVSVPAGETREVTYGVLTRPVAVAIDPDGEVLLAGPREGWRPVRVHRFWFF
jgi:hypothetical protein